LDGHIFSCKRTKHDDSVLLIKGISDREFCFVKRDADSIALC